MVDFSLTAQPEVKTKLLRLRTERATTSDPDFDVGNQNASKFIYCIAASMFLDIDGLRKAGMLPGTRS